MLKLARRWYARWQVKRRSKHLCGWDTGDTDILGMMLRSQRMRPTKQRKEPLP